MTRSITFGHCAVNGISQYGPFKRWQVDVKRKGFLAGFAFGFTDDATCVTRIMIDDSPIMEGRAPFRLFILSAFLKCAPYTIPVEIGERVTVDIVGQCNALGMWIKHHG